jgi:hypothetical protein
MLFNFFIVRNREVSSPSDLTLLDVESSLPGDHSCISVMVVIIGQLNIPSLELKKHQKGN